MKKNVFLSVIFSIISIIFFTSCKKKVIEPTKVEIINPSLSIEMIDGTHAIIIAECQSVGNMDGVKVNLRGAITLEQSLKKNGNVWSDTLSLSNNGTSGYVHGFFKPIYGGITHSDEGVNSVTSDDPYLEWIVKTEVHLGEATHTPTETGGTSTIEISENEEDMVVNVLATKVEDNSILGEYAISVSPSDNTFDVLVNYTDHPIFNTLINLRVSVDDRVKNYQYTTLEEESCGLNFVGDYVDGESEVHITISGNDRPSSFTFKALNNNTLLNTYEGTMSIDEENKTFTFPIESGEGLTINYIVTSEQHPLCVFDEFIYITPVNPDPVTTISVSGTSPGSLRPSGGTIFGSYTNVNVPNGTSTLVVQTPSEEILLVNSNGDLVSSIEVELSGDMGTFTYDFVSDRDENEAVFLYSCDYFESQPSNTYVTTLTQTYDLIGSVDVVEIDSLQLNTTQFISCDLNTNYVGTNAKKITLKIKNTLSGYHPWEYLSLLVINEINFPVGNQSDWGNTDSDGFYTFEINNTENINLSNIDFIKVGYRSKDFLKGNGDSFEIKVSVEVDFLDNTTNTNFQPWSQTLSVGIE